MRALWIACLLVLSMVPASAQAPQPAASQSAAIPDAVQTLAGAYELADADAKRRCAITLEARVAAPGFGLSFAAAECNAAFTFLAPAIAWTPGPASTIRLLDKASHVVAEFGETETGLYEMARPGEGVFFLASAANAAPRDPTPAELAGTWTLARQTGRPICRLTLTDRRVGNDNFALSLAAGCDPAFTALGPVSWRTEHSDLVFNLKTGESLRFEQEEEKLWRKVPEDKDPLMLSR